MVQPLHFPLSISAIVIDLDGTLLHTAPELTEAANRMLRDMDYPPVAPELLMSYIGNGISWLVKRALTGDMHATPDAALYDLSLIHISEPTRLGMISYAVFCLKKKKKK